MKRLLFLALAGYLLASCSPQMQVAKKEPDTLRIMSYNIHHANPPSMDTLTDINAIAAVIRKQDPDLVALQEVDMHTWRSGRKNQAKLIARKLGMNYFFGRSIDYDGGKYGLAILSRLPITEEQVHRLPTELSTQGEPRILATVKVQLPDGRPVRFASVHLDAQQMSLNRRLQMTEVNRIADADTIPMIIAGDFNATEDTEVISRLDENFERTCKPCAPTIPVAKPEKTLDYIGVKPRKSFRIVSHKVIPEKYASDHLPVVAVVRLDSLK
ncbi:MAG: endonuclease/exonuclease/phosphatase family protein [Mucilaginibacter polytrichastri]|nr:endonuclease/exonuclease/phosphatase family protein [Mucilaginibacter polytrichastri]